MATGLNVLPTSFPRHIPKRAAVWQPHAAGRQHFDLLDRRHRAGAAFDVVNFRNTYTTGIPIFVDAFTVVMVRSLSSTRRAVVPGERGFPTGHVVGLFPPRAAGALGLVHEPLGVEHADADSVAPVAHLMLRARQNPAAV